MRLLDLFCGRWGWSRAFAARGWECVGVDLTVPSGVPSGCEFIQLDVLAIERIGMCTRHGAWCACAHSALHKDFDFVVASPPCENFAVWGMRHFHPEPPWPHLGITIFNHTRSLCEASGLPYVMENVKPAQRFVGQAQARCGSFYLWGNAISPILPQGIRKGASQMRRDGRFRRRSGVDELMYLKKTGPDGRAAKLATIPPELANCVADYAERLLEQKSCA